MNNFEIKKKIVLSGNSEIFKNWSEHSNITKEDFIEALEWLCNDPLDESGRMTREIGLTPDRIVKLSRGYTWFGKVMLYLNGRVWCGAQFTRPCQNEHEKLFSLDGKNVQERHKISLCCRARV